ncbi:helix-turn-helix domain-containing protein [Streptomyces seoulensis]|uniref:helix-turn-helix domain-containing protein n=1 Tax=Streptomyces seoulensis TaxID=73044 RepID=UPI003C2F197F
MVKQLPIAAEPDDGCGQRAGRRSAVRYLRNEASPSATRMVLGAALRRRREAISLMSGEAAEQLGGSRSKMSRIESGNSSFKEQDLLRFFSMYEITDPEDQDRLRELAAIARQPAWWQPWSTVAQKYLQAFVSFEDMAVRVRSFETVYLYGLLQTPEYARALIERGRGTTSQHEELIRLRAERWERFVAAPEKKLICIVDEASLRRPVGSPAIMRGQLRHLIELTSHPSIQLRLAPLNNYKVHVELGPTTTFDFAGHLLPTICFAEGFDGGLVVDDEQMVDRRVKAFDALAASSLSPIATKRRLQDLLAATRYA